MSTWPLNIWKVLDFTGHCRNKIRASVQHNEQPQNDRSGRTLRHSFWTLMRSLWAATFEDLVMTSANAAWNWCSLTGCANQANKINNGCLQEAHTPEYAHLWWPRARNYPNTLQQLNEEWKVNSCSSLTINLFKDCVDIEPRCTVQTWNPPLGLTTCFDFMSQHWLYAALCWLLLQHSSVVFADCTVQHLYCNFMLLCVTILQVRVIQIKAQLSSWSFLWKNICPNVPV